MNAADILKYGNITMLSTLEKLPDSHWNTPNVCGWWSSRQIAAHLTSFELALVEVLSTFLGNPPGETMKRWADPQYDFNLREVAARADHSAGQILAEYTQAYQTNMELIAQIPIEMRRKAGALPWYGEEYDLEDFLVYTFYAHKREHMAQVNVFLDTLKN